MNGTTNDIGDPVTVRDAVEADLDALAALSGTRAMHADRMREAMRWLATKFEPQAFLNQPESDRSDSPGMLIAFFEQAGIMIQKRFVNEDVVLDHLARHVVANWNKLKPLIEHERRQLNDDRVGEHFEYLYRRAVAYEAKQSKK